MEKDNIIKVFNGSQMEAMNLKGILEENDISVTIRKDFLSVHDAVYGALGPISIDLYILDSDEVKARPFIDEFVPKEE